ncbi:hypothetical protein [Chamaesiphon sp. GL140_3_metabinner_50]|uniref:hypothetical protein n=1 Tax=Chamaesiphon sp. GL140_3_metabinner_50 TaxID=2970812 RepID=UPI0025D95775|nr:hypothetical protein [Chamaesiphon sp. GL140_3_metabinner_50]
MNRIQKIALAMGATFTMGIAMPLTTMAQTHRNLIQRHPNATGAVAGYAAYKAAKGTGRNRSMSGGHRNIMQRHPVLTGVAAAGVAHHYAKKHR